MNYVKAYLKRNKLTREQLAARLDVSISLIDKLAAGSIELQKTVKLAMQKLESE
jgi:transcriptional regulator with XRE-family HTH domain